MLSPKDNNRTKIEVHATVKQETCKVILGAEAYFNLFVNVACC